jgi:8-oxo-dGTP pyrophosphatase MutT (NUDIX family)
MTDQIRPAATLVLWRDGPSGPEVLMGQRGAGAVFMPSKFVFPGGGVDPADHAAPCPDYLGPDCARRLGSEVAPDAPSPGALVAAALRELTEETGLCAGPARTGALRFVFRAITPPGRPRRFDARFLLAEASTLRGDAEDFAQASGELDFLRWLPLPQARALDLPFVTEVVLAELGGLVDGRDQPGVPFFDNSGPSPLFRRIV